MSEKVRQVVTPKVVSGVGALDTPWIKEGLKVAKEIGASDTPWTKEGLQVARLVGALDITKLPQVTSEELSISTMLVFIPEEGDRILTLKSGR